MSRRSIEQPVRSTAVWSRLGLRVRFDGKASSTAASAASCILTFVAAHLALQSPRLKRLPRRHTNTKLLLAVVLLGLFFATTSGWKTSQFARGSVGANGCPRKRRHQDE